MFKRIALATIMASTQAGSLYASDFAALQTRQGAGYSSTTRIAVVGAGPAGLTAARELKLRGYSNVTVFEKDAQVGGKVMTIQAAPGVSAELGAVFANPDYTVTLALAQAYNIPTAVSTTPRYIFADGVKQTSQQFLATRFSPEEIGAATANYRAMLAKFPQIFAVKLNNLPDDLSLPFSEFVEKHSITVIAELVKALVVGFGYSYYEDAPAIYMLKIVDMLVDASGPLPQSKTFFSFPTGFQSLWKAVASDLNVQLATKVTKLDRLPNRNSDCKDITGPKGIICLTTVSPAGTVSAYYDAVIVSAPLSAVGSFIDLTRYEKALFSQVFASRYVVGLSRVEGLVGGESVFNYDNAVASRINSVNVWANPSPAFPVFQTWQLAEPGISAASLDAVLLENLITQGGASPSQGALVPVIRKDWPDYFPRVSSQAINPPDFSAKCPTPGFFDRIDGRPARYDGAKLTCPTVPALQGTFGLFYVGSTLSFETVETSARYAKRLVEERFPSLH